MATPSAAQEGNPLRWSNHEALAGHLSDGLLAGQVAWDTIDSFKQEDRWHALGCQGLRLGIGYGVAELVKRAVQRERPDHSDHFSFPSSHTMGAAIASRGNGFGISLTIAVGDLRGGADKHHISDIVAGAALGFVVRRVCQK